MASVQEESWAAGKTFNRSTSNIQGTSKKGAAVLNVD
jgi:hypothetical protein